MATARAPAPSTAVGIAALDPIGGVPLSWNPGRERGIQVWRMTPTPQGLYVLSDSIKFAGEWHPRFTYLLTAGGAAPVRATELLAADQPRLHGHRGRRGLGDPRTASPSGPSTAPSSVTRPLPPTPPTGARWSASSRPTASPTGSPPGGAFERSTDGSTWTLAGVVDRRPVADITAATYANGLIYYTVSGDSRLYEVGFGVENGLVSTLPARVVSGDGDGLGWSGVRGLTYAGGKLLARPPTGSSTALTLANRRAVPASLVQVSGPGCRQPRLVARAGAARDRRGARRRSSRRRWSRSTSTSGSTPGRTWSASPSTHGQRCTDRGRPRRPNADVTGARASGSRAFSTATAPEVCAALSVNVTRQTTSTVLMRLRTAGNGAIARVFITASRRLYIRSDVAGAQMNTGLHPDASAPGPGSSSAPRRRPTATSSSRSTASPRPVWNGNTGTANAGIIELGDAAANSWAGAFDDVFVDDVVAPTP